MPARLSTPKASEYLSLPESTLRYYRHIGKGPASYVLGRKLFYDVSDLDASELKQKLLGELVPLIYNRLKATA
jgi:hypothetical protein